MIRGLSKAAVVLIATCALAQQTRPVKVYESTDAPATQTQTPGVQVIQAKTPDAATLGSRKTSGSFEVGPDDWLDTGFVVVPGDSVTVQATGSMTLGDGRTSTPDGIARGWKDLLRVYPLNSANSGALIGRIGQTGALPFLIGSEKTIEVVSPGNLYLRANLSADLSGSGEYNVKLTNKLGAAQGQKAATPNMAQLVSPATFANIPRRVQDEQHNPGDMVNFGIIGTQDQVKQAFKSAGWVAVDKNVQSAVVSGLIATLSQQAYTAMPMSTLYLFGRPQDLSYAHADPLVVAAVRHHLRVWQTTETIDGRPLWVGSSTYDNGFEKDQRNGGVTHSIDPNVDKERDFLYQSFAAAGAVNGAAYVTPENPLTSAKTATGGSFHSDGRIVVMNLR